MNFEFAKYKLPVNWENGMMITESHLRDFNEFVLNVQNNSILSNITPFNYGILPSYSEKFENLRLSENRQGDNFTISVSKCALITFDGLYININPETIKNKFFEPQALSVSIKLSESFYNYALVYFTYNFDEQIKVGAVDIEKDEFERKANTNYSINLTFNYLENKSDISTNFDQQGNSFPIALLNISNKEKPSIEKTYIPPCINFYSNEILSIFYGELTRKLQKMLESVNRVRSFVNYDLKESRVSFLTHDLNMIFTSISPFVIDVVSALLTDSKVNSPIELLSKFKKLAIAFNSSIHSLEPEDRREIENYFAEQYGTPNDLALVGGNLINAIYSHSNINDSCLKPISEFTTFLVNLFSQMAEKGLSTKVFSADDSYMEQRTASRKPKEESKQEMKTEKTSGLFDDMVHQRKSE